MKWYYIAGIVVFCAVAGYFLRYATEDKWLVKGSANGGTQPLDSEARIVR